jgi:hypothetical protein
MIVKSKPKNTGSYRSDMMHKIGDVVAYVLPIACRHVSGKFLLHLSGCFG